MDTRWLYDEEVYPNCFILSAKIPGTNQRRKFQISPLADQRNEMVKWMLNDVIEMVGYNNLFYDYPVLHYLITKLIKERGSVLTSQLYNYSSKLIKGNVYSNIRTPLRKQIDIFKINHFDNKAKMTSLKLLEFNLRMKKIEELPYPPGTILTESQIWDVSQYCDLDVDATDEVYQKTIPEIELREKMSPMFNIDFTNFNASKMGEYILVSKIIEELGEHKVYNRIETSSGGIKKKIINTKRDIIHLRDVVFDYVEFQTEPFQKILDWFKNKSITETKGVFSKIPFEELEVLEPHYCVQKVVGKQKTLNVVNFGFQYDFGVGGIHGSIDAGIYEADDEWDIEDIDVASYYPNLAIKNKFFPEHLGIEFCSIYESIYEERKKYPKKTHKMENLALKLALNGSYGKSNSEYSPLYDPMYTMKTTVNGQLLLCMLSEQLMMRIPGCIMLQINTDGMTIKYRKVFKGLVKVICNEWERLTQLELESVNYSRMIIKDVNNYLAVAVEGWVKRKGAAFIYKEAPGELEMHKNFSQLIVPKALEAYFVNGIKPEEFIPNHDDVYDFFKRTKIRRADKLLKTTFNEKGNITNEEETQRITRYIVSGETFYDKETKTYHSEGQGTTLIKKMPPLPKKMREYEEKMLNGEVGTVTKEEMYQILERCGNIEAGYLCSVFNDIEDEKQIKDLIYYQYYIDETYKVINIIEQNDI